MASSLVSLPRSKARNRREWPRYKSVRSFSLAARADGRLLPCTVEDISLGGAKLAFDEELPAGEILQLSHADGRPVTCARVWQDRRTLGVQFDFSEDSLGLISICIRNMIDLEPRPQAVSA